MDNETRILLDDTIEFCRRGGQDKRLISMLEQSTPAALDDDSFTIEAPSRFAYSHLIKSRDVIERYLEEITFTPLKLNVLAPYTMPRELGAEAEIPSAVVATAPAAKPIPQMPLSTPTPVVEATPAPNPQHAPAKGGRGINVTNTLSPDAWRKMMEDMKSGEPARPAAVTTSPTPAVAEPESAAEQYPSVGIGSKFTFENFVFGDENKHAYQSSLRFAAFAEEPGQCTSLFIYGNSGLGKTHLLFAIKNYLAQEKPHIRVKYASSQVYIDDYMRDLGMQKGPGDPIMREYRDADVLIIDDIQNIIGRQASIEFFFQLVDEFIRSGKKIVIASDRAPKKLGLDERLTSRFNAGMLCLVSDPGFEMKYAILKRYYENIIMGSPDMSGMNVDTSLLSSLQVNEGRLSDEHLRHMAEISGNNIRELESFCERCAGLSSEREQEGRELSAEDIDRIADEYFDTAHKVVKPTTIMDVVEEYYHVSHADIIGHKRTKNIAFPRHVAAYLANTMCEMSLKAVGALIGRDHTTVISSIKVIEKRKKEDASFGEELERLRGIILLKS